MAHLVRCWCGKKYRCDIEHPIDNKFHVFAPDHENNCPDIAIHGPYSMDSPIVIKSERFAEGVDIGFWTPVSRLIEENSLKDTHDKE